MMAVTRGVGPESLKIRCSNEETSGMGIMVVFISFLIIAAIPPPRPCGRGLSMYVNPAGVI